jgi:hemoglobin-like flavoprotein
VVVEVTGTPAREFNFRMRPWAMIDEDTRVLVRSQRMLTQDPNAAKAIDLTPEQIDKLKAVEPPRIVIEDVDRQHVIALWHAWEKVDTAHKPAAQEAILDALRDVGQKSIEPTKKAWTDAADAVKKTLTLQQMAKLAVYQENNPTGWGGPNRFPPATQPR